MIRLTYKYKQLAPMIEHIQDWCNNNDIYYDVIDYIEETDTVLDEDDFIYYFDFKNEDDSVTFVLKFGL